MSERVRSTSRPCCAQALAPVEPPAELTGAARDDARLAGRAGRRRARAVGARDAERPAATGPASVAGRRRGGRLGRRRRPGRARAPSASRHNAGAPVAQRRSTSPCRTLRDGGREARQAPRRPALIRATPGRRTRRHARIDDLRALADEDLMQLVAARRPARVRGHLRPPRAARPSRSPTGWSARGNVAEDVVQEAFLSIWRSGARYERARGSVRTWVLGIVHHRAIDAAAPLVGARQAPRQRRGDRGAPRGRERTDVEVARREEARERPRGDGDAARRAVQGDRARLLRRLHPHRDRRHARHAGRHREGPHAARAREAARRSSAAWRRRAT